MAVDSVCIGLHVTWYFRDDCVLFIQSVFSLNVPCRCSVFSINVSCRCSVQWGLNGDYNKKSFISSSKSWQKSYLLPSADWEKIRSSLYFLLQKISPQSEDKEKFVWCRIISFPLPFIFQQVIGSKTWTLPYFSK